MTKRRVKRSVVYCLYGVIFISLCAAIFIVGQSKSYKDVSKDDDYDYTTKTVFDDTTPVVTVEKTLIRPYTASDVKIVKNFYDYQAEASEQQQSIIVNEKTYLQNSGVSYGSENIFDVSAILDGTVTKVSQDELLGNIIEITHDNDIISVYQSLSEVNVKEQDTVTQGQIIGKSGTSNISKDLNNHLYFELAIKGNIVNPENYYDKKLSEL